MKRIKNYLLSTMSTDRMSSLALLHIHKDMDVDINNIEQLIRIQEQSIQHRNKLSEILPNKDSKFQQNHRQTDKRRARYTPYTTCNHDHKHDGSYKARPLSSPLTSPYTCAQNDHPLVTIETSNHFRLAADLTSLHVSLKKRDQPTVNNVFRQIDFGPDVNGKGRLMVFQLLSNPFYYLATSSYRHLEIQSYCDDTLDREVPDERFFRCFHSAVGAELIQPYAHPGYYIHHIDDFVNVRKLELNFRPPEEFFLDVKMCSNEEIQRLLISETDQYNTNAQRDSDVTSVDSKSGSLPRTAVPDIDKSSLKRKESKKLKGKPKDSPITPKASVLGCFRLKVFKKKKKDKTK
ncbi:hypothetical protein MAR_013183 [Mya arenaria]|uniref:Uncharacterized protein n=1 Tax=Mya arenaria TaxID=6604 RepID=A0ABY7G1U2_MYAAR|nr:hypothetical protein MAR_013183 [Mya arenaria]